MANQVTNSSKTDNSTTKVEQDANLSNESAQQDTIKQAESVQGRGVFMVETVAAGVAVHTGFLTEDERLLRIPAIFPDVHYALAQIDELKQIVMSHFSQAAQVGAQVLASQSAQVATDDSSKSVTPSKTDKQDTKLTSSKMESTPTAH